MSLSPNVVIDEIDNSGTNAGNITDSTQPQANDIDIRTWIEFLLKAENQALKKLVQVL